MVLERIYFSTMILLILHQIDAAYWQEWNLFNLPGGVQGYLLFNFAIIPVVIYGYKQVVTQSNSAGVYSYFCGSLGVATFLIHACLAAFGAKGFNVPLSVITIVLCFVSGLYQILKTRKFFASEDG